MLLYFIRTSLRQLWRHRLYSAISLISLTIGLTIVSLTTLHARHEFSFNANWPGAENVYFLTQKQNNASIQGRPSTYFDDETIFDIRDYVSDLTSEFAEILPLNFRAASSEVDEVFSLALSSKSFFKIFRPVVVAGNLSPVMESDSLIALEKKAAVVLFGSADAAMGRRIVLENAQVFPPSSSIMPPQPTEFEVAAVYELPEPVTRLTRFQAVAALTAYSSGLLPLINGEKSFSLSAWIKLEEETNPELVDAQLDRYVVDQLARLVPGGDAIGSSPTATVKYEVNALMEAYFDQTLVDNPKGDAIRLAAFVTVGILVLLAGCSNVISLRLAVAMKQHNETGIRKSVGAESHHIASHGIVEALVLSLLALIPTVELVRLLHPAYSNLLGVSDLPDPGLIELALMAGIALCVGVINGFYPAFILARLSPVEALKSSTARKYTLPRLNARSLLVGAQFFCCVILLISTVGLYLQLWVTRNQPLGFDSKNLAAVSVNPAALETRGDIALVLADALSALPGIDAALPVVSVPILNRAGSAGASMLVRTQQDVDGPSINLYGSKPGLFNLLQVPLLAGRDLNTTSDIAPITSAQDMSQPVRRMVLNNMAVNALSISPDDIIGTTLYLLSEQGESRSYSPVEIVGVVGDSMVATLRARPSAAAYYLEQFVGFDVLFRFSESIRTDLVARVSNLVQEITGYSAAPVFLEDQIMQVFAKEQREGKLMLLCALLAMFLSCIGLYGLVSFSMESHIKEIGVRKVMGASTISIVSSFLIRFSRPILIANAIAWPAAGYFVLRWITTFPYQLDKTWILPVCLGTTTAVLIVSWTTAGLLALRAASSRPSTSLRYE